MIADAVVFIAGFILACVGLMLMGYAIYRLVHGERR